MKYFNNKDKDLTIPKTTNEQIKPNSNNIIEQMVYGIVGKESENPTERETEIRRQLSGRAWEYLMFMDDE